jgi:hypothetical protein
MMLKNVAEPERPQKIWRLRVACWISKQAHARAMHPRLPTHPHTHTRTQARMPYPGAHARTEIYNAYCFPRQQWFRERASMPVLLLTVVHAHITVLYLMLLLFSCVCWSAVEHTLCHVFLCIILLPILGMMIQCGLLYHHTVYTVCVY